MKIRVKHSQPSCEINIYQRTWNWNGNLVMCNRYLLKTWKVFQTNEPNTKNRKTKTKHLKPLLFSSKGIPSTPQHTDFHPCTRPKWSRSLSEWSLGHVGMSKYVMRHNNIVFRVYLYRVFKNNTMPHDRQYPTTDFAFVICKSSMRSDLRYSQHHSSITTDWQCTIWISVKQHFRSVFMWQQIRS